MKISAIASILCLGCLASSLSAQHAGTTADSTSFLRVRSAVPLATKPFSFHRGDCDDRNDIVFDLGLTGPKHNELALLRVSADGQTVAPLPVPSDLGDHGEWHLSVSAAGDIFVTFSQAEEHLLLHYSALGAEINRTTLELPSYFHIRSFALLPNGKSMFLGSLPQPDALASGANLGKDVLIWLDEKGKRVRTIPKNGSAFDYLDLRGGSVVADSTSFVEVSDSTVTTFDSIGTVMTIFPLSPPASDAIVSSASILSPGKTVAIEYLYSPVVHAADPAVNGVRILAQTWQLVDLITGRINKTLSMPSSFMGSSLCALRTDQFIYFTVREGQPTLITATEWLTRIGGVGRPSRPRNAQWMLLN